MHRSHERERPNTSNWTDLFDLHELHANEKCFIVGAGPSVAFLDLSGIYAYPVIAVNSAALLMPWESGDPARRFWISNDVLCMQWSYFWTHVFRARATRIVRDSWKKHYVTLSQEGFRFFTPRRHENDPLDSDDPGLCSISSVPTAIDLALKMGCKKIFLLGVDQRIVQNKSHFWQFWDKTKWPQRPSKGRNFLPEQSHQKKVFESNKAVFMVLNKHAQRIGAQVFNCNRKSALGIFPIMSLNEAVHA